MSHGAQVAEAAEHVRMERSGSCREVAARSRTVNAISPTVRWVRLGLGPGPSAPTSWTWTTYSVAVLAATWSRVPMYRMKLHAARRAELAVEALARGAVGQVVPADLVRVGDRALARDERRVPALPASSGRTVPGMCQCPRASDGGRCWWCSRRLPSVRLPRRSPSLIQ